MVLLMNSCAAFISLFQVLAFGCHVIKSCKTSICVARVPLAVVGAVSALHQPGRGRRGEPGGGRVPHGRAVAERRPRGLPDTRLAPRGLHRHGDGLLRLHAAVQEMHHRVSGDGLSDHLLCFYSLHTHTFTISV